MVELTEGVDHVPDRYTVKREGALLMDQHSDGACVALDPLTKLCTIYEIRPQVCRDFTRGEPLCRKILSQVKRQPAA